jgi:hypothetical protein
MAVRTLAATGAAVLLQATALRQPPELPPHRSTAVDVAITYSVRRD